MPLPAARDTIGLDLHERETQLRIPAADGAVADRRIATTRAALAAALGSRPPARVLLEASPECEGVARHLEALGRAVVVADPGYAPMCARSTTGSRPATAGSGRPAPRTCARAGR